MATALTARLLAPIAARHARRLGATTLVALMAAASAAGADSQDRQRPYAGREERAIKALSEREITALRAGEGMGLAQAAELNGYPGPLHVLELSEPLNLTTEQRARTGEIAARVRAEAARMGEAVIEVEAEIDRLFAGGDVDLETLAALLERAASQRAGLRLLHLAAHIEMRSLLSERQRATYMTLRGYGVDPGRHRGKGHAHGHHDGQAD